MVTQQRYMIVSSPYVTVLHLLLTASKLFQTEVSSFNITWRLAFLAVAPVRLAVGAAHSVDWACCCVAGPVAGVLTNMYGARAVGMAGGLLGSLGLVLSMFANSVHHLYATFGIITGKHLGPVSESDKTSYRKTLWSLETVRLLV